MSLAESLNQFVSNSLGVNAIEMAIQIGGTVILFLVIKKYFWGNITKYLEERSEIMQAEYDQAKVLKDEAASIKDEATKELDDVRASASDIIEDAKKRATSQAENIVLEAKEESIRIKENTQKEIANEVEKAREEIKEEIVSVATLLAGKIIDKELDESDYSRFIDETTNEVKS